MTNSGALQTMSAWAEDRALLRSTRSADPGAKTGARAERNCSALCSHTDTQQLRDWHQRDKPSRHDAATSGTGCHSPLSKANPANFHFTVNQDSPKCGSPRHRAPGDRAYARPGNLSVRWAYRPIRCGAIGSAEALPVSLRLSRISSAVWRSRRRPSRSSARARG
jgi:hypothetical protein